MLVVIYYQCFEVINSELEDFILPARGHTGVNSTG